MKLPPVHTDITIRLLWAHKDVLKDFVVYLVDECPHIDFSVTYIMAKFDKDNYHEIELPNTAWAFNGSDILKKLAELMEEYDDEEEEEVK